jgi:hypothetical protein
VSPTKARTTLSRHPVGYPFKKNFKKEWNFRLTHSTVSNPMLMTQGVNFLLPSTLYPLPSRACFQTLKIPPAHASRLKSGDPPTALAPLKKGGTRPLKVPLFKGRQKAVWIFLPLYCRGFRGISED